MFGSGPTTGRVYYNTLHCGHPPYSDHKVGNPPTADEPQCPGLVEVGSDGCRVTGPYWPFEDVYGPWPVGAIPFGFTTPIGGVTVPTSTASSPVSTGVSTTTVPITTNVLTRQAGLMIEAANALIDGLSQTLLDDLLFDMNSTERTRGSNIGPLNLRDDSDSHGLLVSTLSTAQKALVRALLDTAISDDYGEEVVTGRLAQHATWGVEGNHLIAIFGDPNMTEPWSWRYVRK